VWNLAGFFIVGLETRWQRFGQFLNDMIFYMKILISLWKSYFVYENLRFSVYKIFMGFSMIFLTIHKISYYKVRASTGSVETCWLCGIFLMVHRNNAGRLGSGFISVCLETRWLDQKSGFYVLERPCRQRSVYIDSAIKDKMTIGTSILSQVGKK